MDAWKRWLWPACATSLLAAAGCHSPYRADQGALLGGLTGAGVGAIIGEAVDQPLAGAAIGAGVGALTGGVIGSNLDQIEAENRAMIEARLGRPAPAGAVSVEDVIAMTRSGVDPDVIATHVRIHGVMTPPQAADLIYLQNNGVDKRVVQAMQMPPMRQSNVVQASGAQPVIVEEHIHYDPWGPPRFGYFHHHHHHGHWRRHRPNVSWGLTFHN